jgi:hypothetical protein
VRLERLDRDQTVQAYHVEWQMRRALTPVLLDDEQRGAERPSVVAPGERSAAATAKARSKGTTEG